MTNPTNTKHERNRRFMEDYRRGMAHKNLAAKYRIGTSRVARLIGHLLGSEDKAETYRGRRSKR